MVRHIALLYLSTIKPSDISIARRLGSDDDSDVYKGRIVLYANVNAIALKVVGIPIWLSISMCVYTHYFLSSRPIVILITTTVFQKLAMSLVCSIVS